MAGWEYKVVPAPTKGQKGKGIKGAEARFAHALEGLMNDMAAEGWEFQRAETLPSIERSGLTGSTTEWRNLLVFRRATQAEADADAAEVQPGLLPAPAPVADTGQDNTDESANTDEADAAFVPGEGATKMAADNGVEETSPVSGMTASLRNQADQRKGADTPD